MSIRDRQLSVASEQAMKEELEAGRFPELAIIQDKVAQKFTDKAAGLPRFDVVPVEEGQVSSSEDYNHMMNNLSEDMNISFDELGYQVDKLMSSVDYYTTEKNLIMRELKLLENRMDTLLEKLNYEVHNEVVFDSFVNFQNIEFNGDDLKNIPKTTAFIDLAKGEVSLPRATGSARIDLSKAAISVKPVSKYLANTELSSPKLCLQDTVNETWRQLVTSADLDEIKLEVLVTLPKVVALSCISFTSNSPKATMALLEVSEDGKTFQSLTSQWADPVAEWSFQEAKVKQLKITLSKLEADDTDGVINRYIFGAQNISAYKDAFQESAVVVSRKFQVPNKNVIDSATLRVDSPKNPGTSIHYYIAIDRDDNIMHWQEMLPNTKTDLAALTPAFVAPDAHAVGYGALVPEYQTFGHNYYSVWTLDYMPAKRTTEIYVGKYMWLHEQMLPADVGLARADKVPCLTDWLTPSGVTTNFVSTFDATLTTKPGNLDKFTTYVYCDQPSIIEENLVQATTGVYFNVYLNNSPLKTTGGVYTYHLKQGWNKIQILAFTEATATNPFVQPGLYFDEVSNKVYANNQRLTEVTLYDLQYNTSPTDLTKFAIDDSKRIIVNYDPKSLVSNDSDYTAYGLPYDVNYKYATETNIVALRFMAILNRNKLNTDVTPVLRNYQIITE